MLRSLMFLFLFAVSIFSTASEIIRFEPASINLQADYADDVLDATVRIFNMSTDRLTIVDSAGSCSCTTALPENSIIEPGSFSDMTVVYTIGDRRGPQKQHVSLKLSQAGQIVTARLPIDIHIPEYFTLNKRVAFWRIDSEPTSKTFRLEASPGHNYLVTGITPPAGFTATLEPDPKQPRVWFISLTPDSTALDQQALCLIHTTLPEDTGAQYRINCLVK